MKPMFLSEVRLRAIPSKLEVVQAVSQQPEDEFEIVGSEVPVFEQKQEPDHKQESE
jgi:hypothetical protein